MLLSLLVRPAAHLSAITVVDVTVCITESAKGCLSCAWGVPAVRLWVNHRGGPFSVSCRGATVTVSGSPAWRTRIINCDTRTVTRGGKRHRWLWGCDPVCDTVNATRDKGGVTSVTSIEMRCTWCSVIFRYYHALLQHVISPFNCLIKKLNFS